MKGEIEGAKGEIGGGKESTGEVKIMQGETHESTQRIEGSKIIRQSITKKKNKNKKGVVVK